MKTVLVAGYFDPLHEGHLDHITKAAMFSDYLCIVTHTDACTERVKKARYTSLHFREFILRAIMNMLGRAGDVVVIDEETVADTIRRLKPNTFAKGGDRTANNMPEDEIMACKEVGCRVVYGVGDQLNRSSEIKAKIMGGAHLSG